MPPITPIPDAQQCLDMMSIVLRKNGISFSKTQAAKIVGGQARLMRLINHGRIRMVKRTENANSKWFCCAGDVIKHIRLKHLPQND